MKRSPIGTLLTAGHRARRLWWRVRRPRTYGVKVLLRHPEQPHLVLAVRHSYVDQQRWALPGGRYHPHRESADAAARREVLEELALPVSGSLHLLTTVETRSEGKRDALTLFTGIAERAEVSTSIELHEARWIRDDLSDLPAADPVSRWLRLALGRTAG